MKEGIVEPPKLDSDNRPSEDAARMETKQKEPNEYLKSLIGGSAGIALVTAYLFLSGYAYIEGYYHVFGLDVSALDFPAYYPLVNSLSLLSVILPLLWVAVIVLPGSYLLWTLRSKRRNSARLRRAAAEQGVAVAANEAASAQSGAGAEPKPNNSRVAGWFGKINWLFLASVIFLGILSSVFTAGKREAQEYYKHPLLKTTLVFKTEALHDLDTEFRKENSEGSLRGLRQTKDFVVVFVKWQSAPCGRVVVVTIPMANLISVRNESLP